MALAEEENAEDSVMMVRMNSRADAPSLPVTSMTNGICSWEDAPSAESILLAFLFSSCAAATPALEKLLMATYEGQAGLTTATSITKDLGPIFKVMSGLHAASWSSDLMVRGVIEVCWPLGPSAVLMKLAKSRTTSSCRAMRRPLNAGQDRQ